MQYQEQQQEDRQRQKIWKKKLILIYEEIIVKALQMVATPDVHAHTKKSSGFR